MRRKKIAQGVGQFRQLDTKRGVVSRVSVQQVQPGRKRCLMPWVRGCSSADINSYHLTALEPINQLLYINFPKFEWIIFLKI